MEEDLSLRNPRLFQVISWYSGLGLSTLYCSSLGFERVSHLSAKPVRKVRIVGVYPFIKTVNNIRNWQKGKVYPATESPNQQPTVKRVMTRRGNPLSPSFLVKTVNNGRNCHTRVYERLSHTGHTGRLCWVCTSGYTPCWVCTSGYTPWRV